MLLTSSHISGSFESSPTQFCSPGFCLASPANPRSPAYANKIRRSLHFKIYFAATGHFGWKADCNQALEVLSRLLLCLSKSRLVDLGYESGALYTCLS